MQRVATKFVPRVLTEDQKAHRVNISQELLDRVSVDETFLKTIVTGDVTWVYGYDVETKAQSSQWVGQSSPRPKKARMSRSNMKVMLLVFFDWQGIIPSTWSDSKQGVLRSSSEAFEGSCTPGEASVVDEPELGVAPRQCTSSLVVLCAQFSGEKRNDRCTPSILLSRFGSSGLFSVSKVKVYFERTPFRHN